MSFPSVLEIIKKYDVKASKKFGQNFLIDLNIIAKIIEAAQIENQDVIEIGPGLGSLTFALLPKVKSLISYEIDQNMINILINEIHDSKFLLEKNDFLKAVFNWSGKKILVANIPYNITSDILFKIFENSEKFKHAVLMVQKEVGERLLAEVNDSNYSKLTLTTQHFGIVSKIIVVKSSCFFPIPKVDSMVLKIEFNNNTYLNSKSFLEFIKNCFAQRRKTIENNLKNSYGLVLTQKILLQTKILSSSRPQELTYNQFWEMFEVLNH